MTNEKENEGCPLCKSSLMKHIFVGLMVFLGAFSAFYVIADMKFHTVMSPDYQFRRIENQMMRESAMTEKRMKKAFKSENQIIEKGNKIIHLVQTKDNYKIIINLSTLNNDENNIEIKANGNILTISGESSRNKKHGTDITKFAQSYAFADDVDLQNLTKFKNGNEYIITIPIKD